MLSLFHLCSIITPQGHNFCQIIFYANHDGHDIYHSAELNGHQLNSLGGVELQMYHWSGCIRASFAQLNKYIDTLVAQSKQNPLEKMLFEFCWLITLHFFQ